MMFNRDEELGSYRIDAFIAGTEKGGTTSLGYYIAQHPNVHTHFFQALPKGKQISEFSIISKSLIHETHLFKKEYLYAFKRMPLDHEVVVAKYVDIMYWKDVAENIKRFFPNCKIIVSLRNPIERAYSSFWYQRYRGEEKLKSFEEAIAQEISSESSRTLSPHLQYLKRGHYYDQLIHLIDLFGKQNLNVIFLEDLKNMPHETIDRIFRFLNLPEYKIGSIKKRNPAKSPKWPMLARVIHAESVQKQIVRYILPLEIRRRIIIKLRSINSQELDVPEISQETRALLAEYFRPHNMRLANLLGRSLSFWD